MSSPKLPKPTTPCKSIRHHDSELERLIDEKAVGVTRRRKVAVANLVVYLRLHPCVDCGCDDVVVLQFDHVRGKKLTKVADLVGRGCWAKVLLEIKKCDVRCASCHVRRHAKTTGSLRYLIAKLVEKDTTIPNKRVSHG